MRDFECLLIMARKDLIKTLEIVDHSINTRIETEWMGQREIHA